jgi:hypothetical protein
LLTGFRECNLYADISIFAAALSIKGKPPWVFRVSEEKCDFSPYLMGNFPQPSWNPAALYTESGQCSPGTSIALALLTTQQMLKGPRVFPQLSSNMEE